MPPPINAAPPLPPPPLANLAPGALPAPHGPLASDAPSEEGSGNFARLSARLAWIAPLFAALLAVIGAAGEGPLTATLLGAAVIAILVGLTFGIIALGNIGRHGKRGILAPAIVGVTLSLAFVIGLGTLILTFNRALNRATAAQAQARTSNATALLNALPLPPPQASDLETTSSPAASSSMDTSAAAAVAAAPPPPAASPAAAATDERLPGWIGVTDRMGLRIVVLQWHNDAPGRRKMRELYAADSTICTVIINNTAGGAHVTIDPASLEFHFLDYTTLKALPPKDVLETAKFDRDYYVKRYGGEWNVAPRKVRDDALAFFPPGTDLTQARAVTMVLNGQRIVVPGKYLAAEEKAQALERLGIGR